MVNALARTIQRIVAPLQRRVRLMVGRGIVNLVNDSFKEQGVQIGILSGEVRDVERYQEYGFTSVPHPGAEAIVVFVGGNRDHGIVIATGDRRYRLKNLADGEVALYDDQGQAVHLKRGNEIYVSTVGKITMQADTSIDLAAPTINMVASTGVAMNTPLVSATGDMADSTRSMAADRAIFNSHTHPGDSGGTTGTPDQLQ